MIFASLVKNNYAIIKTLADIYFLVGKYLHGSTNTFFTFPQAVLLFFL